jgi:predicted secreted protein
MSLFTAIAMYLVIWWTVLFAVLPWGTRPVARPDEVTGWRGAPENPGMLKKVLVTSLVAAVVWLLCWFLITSDWLSFRSGWLALPTN